MFLIFGNYWCPIFNKFKSRLSLKTCTNRTLICVLLTGERGGQSCWVIMQGQLKWHGLCLTCSDSQFYFSVHVFCDHMFSALRDAQKNYMTTSTSGSWSSCWEVQTSHEPPRGQVHQAMLEGMMKCGFQHILLCISAVFYLVEFSDNLMLPLFGVWSSCS